jgi:hypothetical protein
LWFAPLGLLMLAVLLGRQTCAELAVMVIVVAIVAWWRRRSGKAF